MRQHPRAEKVRKAQTDLQRRILEWLQEYELTTLEELAILNHVLSGTISGTLRKCLRLEGYNPVEGADAEGRQDQNDGPRHRRD